MDGRRATNYSEDMRSALFAFAILGGSGATLACVDDTPNVNDSGTDSASSEASIDGECAVGTCHPVASTFGTTGAIGVCK